MNKFKRLFTALLLLALLGAAAVTFVLLNPGRLFRASTGHAGEFGVEETFDRDRVNIALLGFDRNEARDERVYRPDTIMIASLNFQTGEVAVVNIPRDSYVLISGVEIYDKINHAYMHGHDLPDVENPHAGGIETTLRTIEDFLGGVPIHYYVAVDMDGVVEIIDQLGGVDYDVAYPVKADFGRGELLLDQGFQHLDGRQFLTYIRDRSVGGDTARSQRQQQILIAAFAQLKRQGRLRDIVPVYQSLKNNVETNLTPIQIGALALFGLRVEPASIGTAVFPGSIQFAPQGDLDISYIVIDEAKRVELIKEIFGVTVAARTQIVLPGPRRAALPQREPEPVSPGAPSAPELAPGEPALPEPGEPEPAEGGRSGGPVSDGGNESDWEKD
ncbi:MAG: LCP family protein [Bacillota bacterium]